MNLFAMMDKLLRDRASLYEQAAEGAGLRALCLRLLCVFAVTSALYGAAMGSFRLFHPDYYFSDYELLGQESATGRVAGTNPATKKVYTTEHPLPPVTEAEVRFNLSRPTAPYTVVGTGEEKGYGYIALSDDAQLQQTGSWKLPLLVAAKTPLLFVLSLLICSMVLYVLNLAFGMKLRFLPTVTLIAFALAATGVMLGVFVPIAVLFSVVTENYHFMKMMHLLIFALAGLFGVRVLYEGMSRLAPESVGRGRMRTLLLSWLLLYGLVGGQLSWTLKPFVGTPYLPDTPPFRVESGNIYVSFFQSMSQLSRSALRHIPTARSGNRYGRDSGVRPETPPWGGRRPR